MIPCPKCGADTQVRDTRGAIRTRACKDVTCGAKLVTREVAVEDIKLMASMLGVAKVDLVPQVYSEKRERRNKGLCADCNNAREPGRSRCAGCAETHRQRDKARREAA